MNGLNGVEPSSCATIAQEINIIKSPHVQVK